MRRKANRQPVLMTKPNFIRAVDYDENRSACDGNCGATDYCRCTTVSPIFKSVDLNDMILEMIDGDLDSHEVIKYCADRILRTYEPWRPEAWRFTSVRGYYGEEVSSVRFLEEESLLDDMRHMLSLENDSLRVSFALVKEYGYLLESLKDKYFVVCEARVRDIEFPNESYVKKLYRKPYQFVSDIVCVARKQEGTNSKVYVVDGYHRVMSLEEDQNKLVKILLVR